MSLITKTLRLPRSLIESVELISADTGYSIAKVMRAALILGVRDMQQNLNKERQTFHSLAQSRARRAKSSILERKLYNFCDEDLDLLINVLSELRADL